MLTMFFLLNTFLLIVIWWLTFSSALWKKSLSIQLILFIFPVLYGLLNLVVISNIFSLETIKSFRYHIYFYSSLNFLLLIPQWYKLAWTQLNQTKQKVLQDSKKLFIAVLFAVCMIFAIVIFFAVYYLWIYSIGGNKQSLLAALTNYQPVQLDFSTSLYFSFVTYFTLGYGDLIPHGFWMQTFVFFECLVAILNTGIIAVYVYNFLFNNSFPQNNINSISKRHNR